MFVRAPYTASTATCAAVMSISSPLIIFPCSARHWMTEFPSISFFTVTSAVTET
jgi:hypothetical protein